MERTCVRLIRRARDLNRADGPRKGVDRSRPRPSLQRGSRCAARLRPGPYDDHHLDELRRALPTLSIVTHPRFGRGVCVPCSIKEARLRLLLRCLAASTRRGLSLQLEGTVALQRVDWYTS